MALEREREIVCEECGAIFECQLTEVPYFCPHDECKGKFSLVVNE